MPDYDPVAGTLLTPDTLSSADVILEAQDPSVIKWRDGKTALELQREHVTLNQLDLPGDGAHSCWLTAAFKSALDAKPLSDAEKPLAVKAWKDAWDYSVKNGIHQMGVGGTMRAGVELALQFVNAAFPSWNLKAYRFDFPRFDVDTKTQISFYRTVNHGWMVTFGGYVNKQYVGDLLDDGIVQGDDKPAGAGTYGHLRNVFSSSPMTYVADDNYPKRQGQLSYGMPWRNRYRLDDLEKKVQSGQMFRSGYVIMPS